MMNEPSVKYYVMGAIETGAPGNEWRTRADWPPATQRTPFYFYMNGDLRTEKPAVTNAFRSYQYDPKNPVPTLGGRNLLMAAGPYDQRRTENRSDVLIFTTPVLAEPLEVAGKITVRLWVSSSAKDTDFTAKLTDVYPDGRSMLVSDGALRFDPNPNTGRPLRADSVTLVATNTVYLDASHPSHIVLPITSGVTSVSAADQRDIMPTDFVLGQNYPNPTYGETQIFYSLNRTTAIRLKIFNTLGQEVRTLVDGLAPAGTHTVKWDGRDEKEQQVTKGIYFYRLEAGKAVTTKKLIVLGIIE